MAIEPHSRRGSTPLLSAVEDRSSMSLEGSNALVSVVQFYSQALARETQARQQAEMLLKQVLEKAQESRNITPRKVLADVDSERDKLVEAALALAPWLLDDRELPLHTMQIRHVQGWARASMKHVVPFLRAFHEYQGSRDPVDRVEPDSSREGPVRRAPPDGPPDVPG